VVVDSDLARGSELRSIRVTARRDGAAAPMHDRAYALDGDSRRLPGRVVLVARDEDDGRRVTVRVEGELDGRSLVQDASFVFEARRTRYLHMTLLRDCLEAECGVGLTCRAGVCVAPDRAPLTEAEPAGVNDAGAAAMDVVATPDAPLARDAAEAGDAVEGDVAVRVDSAITEVGEVSPCPADMVLIPGGRFLMGSTRHATEQPVHAVRVSAFCLERTEVTVADYVRCVGAGVCPLPVTSGTSNDNALNWGREDRLGHPVNGIRWGHAWAYCRWAGLDGGARRLPTEAEWEFAARGPEGLTYPWGNGEPRPSVDLCWSGGGTRHGTCPIGYFAAELFGLFDMAGNVKEWVEDCYEPYTGNTTIEVSNPRTGPCTNPQVIRGGSWNNTTVFDHAGTRRQGYSMQTTSTHKFGIRCARDLR